MKTDQSIYKFMNTGPEAFRVLTGGLILPGPYRFSSTTVKELERRIDGVFEPVDHEGPVYLLEFQAQSSKTAWYNLATKLGLYGESHPDTDVRGILVFLSSEIDLLYPDGPGNQGDWFFRAVYLDHFLPEWLAQNPNNPYMAALSTLVLSKESLRQQAPRLWQTIQKAPLEPDIRETLSEILSFWFFERFKSLSKEEVWKMLQVLTPLKETRAYQEIFSEGRTEGETMGKAKSLKRLLTRRFGSLPDWAFQRIEGASLEQLDLWFDDVLDAESLSNLLNSGPH